MRISEVSERSGVSSDTLRYYERIGLIPPVNRSKNGIRDYNEIDVKRVEFIKCMRGAGLPIETLIAACRDYPLKNRKKITIEYILMKGVNDSPEAAHTLAKLLKPLKAKINLIPYNAYDGSPYTCPSEDVILKFQDILIANHYTVMIRRSKGRDILAACGQLRASKSFHKT